MKNGPQKLMAGGLLLAAMLAGSMSVFAQAEIEQAKVLFQNKKYDECAKLLEKPSQAVDAKPSVVRLAMQANFKAGNVISASLLANTLMSQTVKPDADMLYEAAEIAELAGDEKAALSRYSAFCSAVKDYKDPRLPRAINFVSRMSSMAEVAILNAKIFGKNFEPAWIIGFFEGRVAAGDKTSVIKLIPFIHEFYEGKYTGAMLNSFWSRFGDAGANKAQILEAFMSLKYPKNFDFTMLSYAWDRIVREEKLDYERQAKIAQAFLDNNDFCPAWRNLVYNPIVNYFSQEQNEAAAKEFAKEVLTYKEKFDKCPDFSISKDFVGFIASNKNFDFIKPEKLGELVARTFKRNSADLYNYDDEGAIHWICDNLSKNRYKDQKQEMNAFLKAAAPVLSPHWARILFANDMTGSKAAAKKSNVKVWLDGKEGFQRDLRAMTNMGALRENGFKSELATAVKNTISTGEYNPDSVYNEITGTGASPKQMISAITEGLKLSGGSPRAQNLVNILSRNEVFKNAENFAAMEAAAKAGNGSDPVLTAASKAFNADTRKPEFEQACDAFLKAFKGNVPSTAKQAKNLQEYVAFRLLTKNMELRDNREAAARMIERWIPRMNLPGQMMNDLLWRANWLDGQKHQDGVYLAALSYAAPAVAKAEGVNSCWGMDMVGQFVMNPNGSAESVMASMYEKQPTWSLDYINANRDALKPAFVYQEAAKIINGKKLPWYDSMINLANNLANSKNEALLKASTPEFWKNLTKKFIAGSNGTGLPSMWYYDRYWGCFFYNNSKVADATKKAVLDAIAEWLMARPAKEQIAWFQYMYSNGRVTAEIMCNVWTKLLEKSPVDSWKGEGVRADVLSYLNACAYDQNWKLPDAQKEQAKLVLNKLLKGMTTGNVVMIGSISDYSDYWQSISQSHYKTLKDPQDIAYATVQMGASLGSATESWRMNNTSDKEWPEVKKIATPQVQYVYLQSLTKGTNQANNEAKNKYLSTMAKLAKEIPGVVPVDKSNPLYPIFVAQQQKQQGSALQAWAAIRDKFKLMTEKWKELDYDFLMWAVDMARIQKMYDEANTLAQTIWMDEGRLSPENAAKLGLLKGDIYRDQKNYAAARIEYESLNNSPRYQKTEGGRMSKFRLVELLILTEDYSSARTMLERLIDSRTVQDQAEAYYLLARLEFQNNELEQAKEYLKEVFKRQNDHVDGRLLEGTIQLKLGRISETELEIGNIRLATIAIPGRPLVLLINDSNLGVVRGGKALPVIVKTTKGNDLEKVELLPTAADMNKFTATVPTSLGKAVPNNGQIEVNGDDEIVYQIDPDFQKANGIERAANRLKVISAAKLYASAKPILSEEAQDEILFQQSMAMSTGRSYGRDVSKTIRPGNQIYLRVIDADMCKDPNKPDTLKVDLSCSSGDVLNNYVLTETGDATGIFEAKVQTGIPFPNATASDTVEGLDINAVINVNKNGSWKSRPDSVKPKYLELDTMSSYLFTKAAIDMPNPDSVRSLTLTASLDNTGDDVLCTYPQSEEKPKGGVMFYSITNVKETSLQQIQKRFAAPRQRKDSKWLRNPVAMRGFTGFQGRAGNMITMMDGVFYLPESKEMELKFTQPQDDKQNCYLLIDGEMILGGQMNSIGIAATRSLFIQKGIHTFQVFSYSYEKTSRLEVGYAQEDGSYLPLPAAWFDPEKNPALEEYLRPKGKIKKTSNGFEVVLEKDQRYRRLKWVFNDYAGNQLEVTKAYAYAKDDKVGEKVETAAPAEGGEAVAAKEIRILPAENDLTTGRGNQTLEVAAADSITVKYNDENRLDPEKAILTDHLSSSFADATVSFQFEEVTMTDEGEAKTTLSKAVRAQVGDAVQVTVSDPDMDISEERETIPVEIFTSSGEKLKLELLENGDKNRGGSFSEVLRFGEVTDPTKNQIALQPGDKVTARYLDKENNKPGIPMYREATLINSVGAKPLITPYLNKIKQIEDKSPVALAKIQQMRNKGDKREDIKLYKSVIESEAIKVDPKNPEAVYLVNSKTPLLFELTSPDLAKHAKSITQMDVLTQTEVSAAEAERRDPVPLTVKMSLTPLTTLARAKGYQVSILGQASAGGQGDAILERGVFSGVVRLQLGSATDEINDIVSSNESFNLLNSGNSQDSDAFRVPTVLVGGSDKVYLSYKDADGNELVKYTLQLRSDGELMLMDKNYLTPNAEVHLGQSFYVKVYDPDCDISDERDSVEVKVKSGFGDAMTLKLSETLPHSGIFTGSLKTALKPKPLADQQEPKKLDDSTIWTTFGDKIDMEYVDQLPLTETKPVTLKVQGTVVIGSDAEVSVFTKKFKDPEMAVKTNFLMAEALFEMAKSHREMKDAAKEQLAKEEIAKGKRVLEEALRDYPDTTLKAQGEFLLANLAQQLENYHEAVGLYSAVLSRYPESQYAVKSQFQKAICLEKMNQFLPACEEYVKLTYLYPEDKLAADAKLRLANHYYKQKNYKTAMQIFRKFAQKHTDHQLAPKGMLLAGYAARKFEEQKTEQAAKMKTRYVEDYTNACSIFEELLMLFPGDKTVRPEAMYWLGDLWYKMAGGNPDLEKKSYQMLQNLIWDYPESNWAKVARGRLAERK